MKKSILLFLILGMQNTFAENINKEIVDDPALAQNIKQQVLLGLKSKFLDCGDYGPAFTRPIAQNISKDLNNPHSVVTLISNKKEMAVNIRLSNSKQEDVINFILRDDLNDIQSLYFHSYQLDNNKLVKRAHCFVNAEGNTK